LWVVAHSDSTTSVATIGDSLVNTYSAAIDALVDSNDLNKLTDFSVSDSLAGANTVTASFSGTPAFRAIYISELLGVQNLANDGHNANSQLAPGTATDAVTSNAASNSATAFMIALSSNDHVAVAPTKGTGFTLDINAWLMGGATNQATIEFKSGVAIASNAATFTAINATDNANTLMVMFKESVAAGATVSGPFFRAGRGPGAGPSMRRMQPQKFPTPALVDTVTPLPQIQALRSRGPGMGPRLRRMVPQRYPDGIASAASITGKIGAYSWAGVAAPLSVIVAATVGTYIWSGKSSSLSTEVSGKVGAYTWAGKTSSISTSIRSTTGAYTWAGKTSGIAASLVSRVGAYSWSGVAANLSGVAVVQEGVGAYTWAGINSVLANLAPAISPSGGGASGAQKYRQPAWWGDEKKRKLLKKVEAVQLQIEKKREQIDLAPDLFRIERLIEQIQELQKRLMVLLEQVDELNKLAGEEEVLLIYTIYRSLH
jgi:hypothetical protein